MEKEKKYIPERCWVWSPIKGATLNALKNSMKLHEIENYLKEHNGIIRYRGNFYESVYDVPFVREFSTCYTYCFPTGSFPVAPTIHIVPKGTTMEVSFCGQSRYVFPKGTV